MKGAVERILESCINVKSATGFSPLDDEMEASILANVALAAQGLQVRALAQKDWEPRTADGEAPRGEVESGMTLVGLVGLYGNFLLDQDGDQH